MGRLSKESFSYEAEKDLLDKTIKVAAFAADLQGTVITITGHLVQTILDEGTSDFSFTVTAMPQSYGRS